MTHILHINSNYLTSRLHENLVEKLDGNGFQQTVFMPMKKEMKKEIRYKSNYTIYNPIAFKDVHKYFFSFKQYLIKKNMQQTIDLEKVDVIHAHSLFTDGYAAYKQSMNLNKPFVVTVREFTDKDFVKKRPYLKSKGRKVLNKAEAIIFLTEKSKNLFIDHYFEKEKNQLQKKAVVIPNGIDGYWFENQYKAKRIDKNSEIKLLYVGRIMKSKNIPKIIEALNCLNSTNEKKYSLTIIGDTKEKALKFQLDKMANALPVTFIDRLTREELVKEYRNHDIFIMPSIRESFGLVYLEAMSQGLPIVYSTTGGFYGTFKEGEVGYAAQPSSEKDIAEKVRQTISNYDRLSQNALVKYQQFNWDLIGKQYVALYKAVLNTDLD